MSERLPENEVFKFMSVRPPAKKAPPKLEYIAYVPVKGSWAAQVEGHLLTPEQRSKAVENAKKFVQSDQFYLRSKELAPLRSRLVDVSLLLQQQNRRHLETDNLPSDLINQLEEQLGQSIKAFTQAPLFSVLRQQLWDSLLAQLLDGADDAAKTELSEHLALVQLLEQLASYPSFLRTPEQLQQALARRPLLPREWRQPSIARLTPASPPLAQDPAYVQFDAIWTRIKTLKQARLEIEQAFKLYKNRMVTVQADQTSPPLTPNLSPLERLNIRPVTPSLEGLEISPALGRMKPWVLDELAVKTLGASTLSLLASHRMDVKNEQVKEITHKLEEDWQATLHKLMYQQQASDVYHVGSTIRNSSSQTAQWLREKLLEEQDLTLFAELQPLIQQLEIRTAHTQEIRAAALQEQTQPRIKPVGVGDLHVLTKRLIRYEEGEIAHIENILQRESKERKHRRLRRHEESTLFAEETVTETQKDLQSTERFELENEAQQTISSLQSAEAGLTVSGSYGPVQVTAHGEFAFSNTQEKHKRSASNYAKEITNRSVSSIREKVRQERTKKSIEEFEEINTHGFDNSAGDGHVIGVYRWVDKVYEAKVVNYGRRQMYEFIIPEPAAFYIHAQQRQSAAQLSIVKPPALTITHTALTRTNYSTYTKLYQVAGVTTPPAQTVVIATAMELPFNDKVKVNTKTNLESRLEIPEGYQGKHGYFDISAVWLTGGSTYVLFGNRRPTPGQLFTLNDEQGFIPISVNGYLVQAFVLNAQVECVCTSEHFEAWQLETYDKIAAAYEAQRISYEEKLAQLKLDLERTAVRSGHPEQNRTTEQVELKRNCIDLLTNQSFHSFNAIKENSASSPYPEVIWERAIPNGRFIQFFEQAFEWNQMTYLFYPYFWGRKNEWLEAMQLKDNDPLFTAFLQAGAAKVLVPVRPGYDEAVLHYLATGDIWNGDGVPVMDDALYVSIIEELKEASNDAEGTIEDAWEIRIPTSLVKLQTSPELPQWS